MFILEAQAVKQFLIFAVAGVQHSQRYHFAGFHRVVEFVLLRIDLVALGQALGDR